MAYWKYGVFALSALLVVSIKARVSAALIDYYWRSPLDLLAFLKSFCILSLLRLLNS